MRKHSDGGAVPSSDVVGQTWQQMTMHTPTHVKFNFTLWWSPEETNYTISAEASDPYTNELLARVVKPWQGASSILAAMTDVRRTFEGLVVDVLNPDPF